MFLTDSVEKRNRRIGSMTLEQRNVKNHFYVEVYCSVQPRTLTVDCDSSLVDRNPLRFRLRRVVTAIRNTIYSLLNSLVRAFNAEISKNLFYLSE